jgi:ABC-type uncharacterized transport system permease subunit
MFLLGNSALKRTTGTLPHRLGTAFVGVGVLFHGYWLYQAIHVGEGLALGANNMASLLGWLTAWIALFLSRRERMVGLASLLLSIAEVGILTSYLPLGEPILSNVTWQLASHILISITAYSLLGIGAVMAIAIALQDARLRNRKPSGWLLMLPSLEGMEQILFSILSVGFILLTLSLFSGLIFVDDMFAQHLAHKTVLSVMAWLVFAILLMGRWRRGWRGKKAIYMALLGFIFLALAYFGSKLVLETILKSHWGLASALTGY